MELVCFTVYTALVCGGHALFSVVYPATKPRASLRAVRALATPGVSLAAAAVFLLGAALGAFFLLPPAGGGATSDALVGPGLILATAPLSYRAARLDLARTPAFTPVLMLIAAVFTASRAVFTMTLVFLPMCVTAMAGIGMAEVVTAHSDGKKLEFSQIGGWGLRLMAESVLGALIAAAIIVLRR
jgi:Sec-independent protein secretion pathway component TatC